MSTAFVVFGVTIGLCTIDSSVAQANDETVALLVAKLQGKHLGQVADLLDPKVVVESVCKLPGAIDRAKIAKCLVDLEAASMTSHFATGNGVIIFRGGLALGITLRDRRVMRIGYVDVDKTDAAIPTVFRTADHVIARFKPSAKLVAMIDKRDDHAATAIVKACIAPDGAIASTRLIASSGVADFDALATQTVTSHTFSPVEIGGKPAKVCEVIRFSHDARPNAAPAPNTRLVNVAPASLTRITGNAAIAPDAKTKTEMQKAKVDRVIGSWKLCLDEKGAVDSLTMLKSTNFASYDAQIERTIKTWRYKPYQVSGAAVPVCTAVTIIFNPSSRP